MSTPDEKRQPPRALAEIVSTLSAKTTARSTVVVGIDGPGGAGKTVLAVTLATTLRDAGRSASVVPFDDFFLPSKERPSGGPETKPLGGDFDWRRLRDEVLLPLREGHVARYRRYDWTKDALAETNRIPPHGIVIVEGIYCTRTEIAELYDVRVWVECRRDVRLARGIRRDGESARRRWELDWMPCEDRYVREQRPDRAAHFIVEAASKPS
jgi:uridine kinase